MSRIEIASTSDGVILTQAVGGLAPALAAKVYIYQHGTTTQADVYAGEEGEATLSQPLTTNAQGVVPGWLDEGERVDLVASYQGVEAPRRELRTGVSHAEVIAAQAAAEAFAAKAAEDAESASIPLSQRGKASGVPSSEGALAITGTPTAGQVLTATSGTAAHWATATGGVSKAEAEEFATKAKEAAEAASIATSAKGVASGVAALDAHGVVQSAVAGKLNTAIGEGAMPSPSGERNVAAGPSALAKLKGGSYNVGVGHNALLALEAGNYNVAIGDDALFRCTASNNTAIGTSALQMVTTGEHLIGIGVNAGRFITASNWNILIGAYAGEGIETEHEEGESLGQGNIAIGGYALGKTKTVTHNVVIGYAAGQEVPSSANNNILLGYEAAPKINAGNVVIGGSAAPKATGSHSTIIGYNAGTGVTSGNGNILIGYEVGPTVEGALNNKLYVNNQTSATPLIGGTFNEEAASAELSLNAGKIGFNGKTPVALVSESLSTGAVGSTSGAHAYGFETEAQAKAVAKFCEKFSKWAHESGLTA